MIEKSVHRPSQKIIDKMKALTLELQKRKANAKPGIPQRPKQVPVHVVKIGRNDPCSCGSGKKYKKCCGVAN